MKRVYLDNAATTPLYPEVINRMTEVMHNTYGNPSSIHQLGRQSRALIEASRKEVATYLGASIGEIFFTSGGTEATNMALKCAVRDLGIQRIISSPIEHHCVGHTIDRLVKTDGVDLDLVEIDAQGRPSLDSLSAHLATANKKTLVSLMHANNELGVITDLGKIGTLCRDHGALFHSDTVQTFGHHQLNVQEIPIDFLTGSAHKFHGPKGTGVLYVNAENALGPLIDGGGQERNMRAGTENLIGIVGLAEALRISNERMHHTASRLTALKENLMNRLGQLDPEITFHGDPNGDSMYTVLNVGFPDDDRTEMLLLNLDIEGVCASGGSACTSGADVGSHVIRHVYPKFSGPSIRFSFSEFTEEADIDFLVEKVAKILGK